jgi:hypothetical protein
MNGYGGERVAQSEQYLKLQEIRSGGEVDIIIYSQPIIATA